MKKSEKKIEKSRESRAIKQQNMYPLHPLPPPRPVFLLPPFLVASLPAWSAHYCTPQKRDNRKKIKSEEEENRKNKKTKENVPVGPICPLVPSRVAVAAGVGPASFHPALRRPAQSVAVVILHRRKK